MSETKQHLDHFQDAFDSGERITVSVTRTGTEHVLTTDESTTVLSCTETVEDQDDSNEALNVTGVVACHTSGISSNQNYLVFEQVITVSATSLTEQHQTTSCPSRETDDKESDQSDRRDDMDAPVGSVGKQIRKDSRGERITGKNPFADPDLIKELDLHHGGG